MATAHNDVTFRGYSSAQAQEYAQARGGYPPKLIEEVISLHAPDGGSFNRLLDLGCGPGSATRDLAQHFEYAFGMDPSAEMIDSARAIGGSARTHPIEFLQGDAESCQGIADGSVDLITAATSGHWFEMDNFWPTAARVLRPGGTVIFFTIWRIWVHPLKTPHAQKIQKILFDLEQGDAGLGPFQKPGNWALMGLYKDLVMPWSLSTPVTSFPESSYHRQVFNESGAASEDGSYTCGEKVQSVEAVERAIGTISAATRWREAHPELAHTSRDCITAAFNQIRAILSPVGVQTLTMVGPSVLVAVQKR